jgi:phage major head subunit gpT-like protein
MDLNRGNMDSMFTGFNQQFKAAFALGSVDYRQFSMEIPVGTSIIEFPFLEQFSGMREWIGPRQIKNVSSKKLAVVQRKFEDTVGIPVESVEDDQYGLYGPIVGQMGVNAGNLWGQLSFEALCANGAWLDGAAFFLTTRKYGKNTINNTTTSALTATTYGAARLAMMSYVGHGGRPLNVMPNLLIVGPKLEQTAKKIVENAVIVENVLTGESTYIAPVGAPNPFNGTAKLLVSTELVGTYDDYWFLADTRGVIKPVMITQRQNPVMTRKDRAEDDNVFVDDQIVYGTRARGEAALTLPHLCYGGIVA